MCSARIQQPAILVAAAIVLTSVTGSAARADSVLITNLADSEIASVGFNDTVIAALSFSTSQIGATLDNAQAVFSANSGTTVFAQLQIDSNNMPGAVVGDLGSVTFTQSTAELATFNATSMLTLGPDEKYWLVLRTNNFDGANWIVASGLNSDGPLGWTIDSRTQSNDGGGTWLTPRTDAFMLFALNGVAEGSVPEPSSSVLLCLGIGLAGAVFRRRTRCAAA